MGVSPKFFEMSRLMTFLLLLATIVVQLHLVCAEHEDDESKAQEEEDVGENDEKVAPAMTPERGLLTPVSWAWSPSPGHGAMTPMSWSPSPARKKFQQVIISKQYGYPGHQYPGHQYPEHGALSPVSWSPSPGHNLLSPYPGHASLTPGHLTPARYYRCKKLFYCSRGGNSFWQKSPCPIGF